MLNGRSLEKVDLTCACMSIASDRVSKAADGKYIAFARTVKSCGSALESINFIDNGDNGVRLMKGSPKIFRSKSEREKEVQKGSCGTCGMVLFSHMSDGNEDQH